MRKYIRENKKLIIGFFIGGIIISIINNIFFPTWAMLSWSELTWHTFFKSLITFPESFIMVLIVYRIVNLMEKPRKKAFKN